MTAQEQVKASTAAERMAAVAAELLAALDPEQRSRASFGFPDDAERRRWFYTPTDHGGQPLAGMRPRQQQAALKLLASGLSLSGYNTASIIMGLENILDREEGWGSRFYRDRGEDARGRDPQLYFVSVFGEPGARASWGWRFGGHHISLSYTFAGGVLASRTPLFFGANPASSPLGDGALLRPLAGEEDLARNLVHSLDDGQRRQAVLAPVAPWDLVSGNRSFAFQSDVPPSNWEIFREATDGAALERSRETQVRNERSLGIQPEHLDALRLGPKAKGLPASALTEEQRSTLFALLERYLGRVPEEVAQAESERLRGAGLNGVHFAWAGSLEPRKPHYYRIQGPRLFVEYDNTQNGANHVHSVWRDPEGDFGDDVLKRHLAESHR